jgi:TRAP-type transport system large permease protein
MLAVYILSLLISLLLLMGAPIAFVLGIPPVSYLLLEGYPLTTVPARIFGGIDNFVLIAIPLFFLVGEFMNETGASKKLTEFVNLFVARFRGGLGHANVVCSTLFAGITGTGVGDVAAIGSVFIPVMEREGYKTSYAAALTASAAVIGPTIPPSVIMVIYGAVMGVSIGALFASGFLPGFAIAAGLMLINYIYALLTHQKPKKVKFGFINSIITTFKAIPTLVTPVIILGGMLIGFFTPTEAAAVATLYAFILGLCYRTLTFKKIYKIIVISAVRSSVIMLIVGCSAILGWIFAVMGITPKLIDFIQAITSNKYFIILLMLTLIFILGMFLDVSVIVILFGPILGPVAYSVGIEPLHWGITMIIGVNIGMITPPMGTCLFASCALAKITLEEITRYIWPFVLVEVVLWLIFAYSPWVAMLIPRFLGF